MTVGVSGSDGSDSGDVGGESGDEGMCGCRVRPVDGARGGDDLREREVIGARDDGFLPPEQVVGRDLRVELQTAHVLAEQDGQLQACCHVADENGHGYFGMFSVSPNAQGGGIGKQLMQRAEQHVAEQWQLPTMQMTVIDCRDELIAFYERRGYRRTGEFKPFPYGDARFGQPRRDDLRFEVLEKPLRAGMAA